MKVEDNSEYQTLCGSEMLNIFCLKLDSLSFNNYKQKNEETIEQKGSLKCCCLNRKARPLVQELRIYGVQSSHKIASLLWVDVPDVAVEVGRQCCFPFSVINALYFGTTLLHFNVSDFLI